METFVIAGIVVGVVVGVLVLALLIWAIVTRNYFAAGKQNIAEAFATIDVYLKKRYDLIPNLVETVKGYAKHESEVLEGVTRARAGAQNASTAAEKIKADGEVTRALRAVNLVAEAYPELKANAGFVSLQSSLSGIETELAQARKYYNAVVKDFNKKAVSFPANIIAKMMKVEKAEYFTTEEAERENVRVQF